MPLFVTSSLFSCPSSSMPTYLTDSFIHDSSFRASCQSVLSDNLKLPLTTKLEVIWDRTISNILVYNLQLSHITSKLLMYNLQLPRGCHGHRSCHVHHGRYCYGGHDRGQDRQNWHLLEFPGHLCWAQPSQFLRCFKMRRDLEKKIFVQHLRSLQLPSPPATLPAK